MSNAMVGSNLPQISSASGFGLSGAKDNSDEPHREGGDDNEEDGSNIKPSGLGLTVSPTPTTWGMEPAVKTSGVMTTATFLKLVR